MSALRIYLRDGDGGWTLHEGTRESLAAELTRRSIVIAPGTYVGDGAHVGDGAYVGDWASVGDRASVGDGAIVGAGARIGNGTIIGAGVIVGAWANVGDGASILRTSDCLTIGPLGRDHHTLTGYRHADTIWCSMGRFCGSIEDFTRAVTETHGDGEHGIAYRHAIAYLRAALGGAR